MERDFTYDDIINLNNLLNPNKDDEQSENAFYSNKTESTLNPGSIGGSSKPKDQIAPPNAKIEIKKNERILTKPKNEIWTEKDFLEENIKEDGRPKPKFEVLYKQNVGTEDIYLGLSNKDISSNSCDQLLFKIYLPDTNIKEIGLEVKDQSIHLTTPKFILNHILQYKVHKEKTEAKWDKDKGMLLLTLFVIKPDILDQLCDDGNGNK